MSHIKTVKCPECESEIELGNEILNKTICPYCGFTFNNDIEIKAKKKFEPEPTRKGCCH